MRGNAHTHSEAEHPTRLAEPTNRVMLSVYSPVGHLLLRVLKL